MTKTTVTDSYLAKFRRPDQADRVKLNPSQLSVLYDTMILLLVHSNSTNRKLVEVPTGTNTEQPTGI